MRQIHGALILPSTPYLSLNRVGAQISEPQYTTLQRISAGTFYWGDSDRLQYTDMEQDTAYAWCGHPVSRAILSQVELRQIGD